MRDRLFRWLQLFVLLIAATALSLGAAVSTSPIVYAAPDDGQWDPTLPKILSAGAPGDPVAIANASFQATQLALQTTQNLGQQFLSSLGLGGTTTGSVTPGARVRGPQAIEYVIRRGGSQMGVPYSWGGGKPQTFTPASRL